MANQWFYARDGQKYGPITGKRLKELALIGVVRRNDLIWSPGYSVWRPAKKFRGLLPKMDATTFNPAMSLFWRPGDLDNDDDGKIKGMMLEPNSAATAITPPLPASHAHTGKSTATSRSTNGPTRSKAQGPKPASARKSSAAGHSGAAGVSTSSPTAVIRTQAPASKAPAATAVVTETKGARVRINLKEKLAIGGGILVLSLIYVVLLLRVL
jgi:hypothetical protein